MLTKKKVFLWYTKANLTIFLTYWETKSCMQTKEKGTSNLAWRVWEEFCFL